MVEGAVAGPGATDVPGSVGIGSVGDDCELDCGSVGVTGVGIGLVGVTVVGLALPGDDGSAGFVPSATGVETSGLVCSGDAVLDPVGVPEAPTVVVALVLAPSGSALEQPNEASAHKLPNSLIDRFMKPIRRNLPDLVTRTRAPRRIDVHRMADWKQFGLGRQVR